MREERNFPENGSGFSGASSVYFHAIFKFHRFYNKSILDSERRWMDSLHKGEESSSSMFKIDVASKHFEQYTSFLPQFVIVPLSLTTAQNTTSKNEILELTPTALARL